LTERKYKNGLCNKKDARTCVIVFGDPT